MLGHLGYRPLWATGTVSPWGNTSNFIALALIYRLTGSGVGVIGVVAAEIAGVSLAAPWADPVIDRQSRVRIMVAADPARMAAVSESVRAGEPPDHDDAGETLDG